MKKTIAILLTLCLCVALCACMADQKTETISTTIEIELAEVTSENTAGEATEPSEEEETTTETEDTDPMVLFEKYLGTYLDSSHYTVKQTYLSLNREYRSDHYHFPAYGYILIDGNLQVAIEKTKLNDLILSGWRNLDFDLTDENQLGAHTLAETYHLVQGGHVIHIGLLNDTDKSIHLKDALVAHITLEQYNSGDYYTNRLTFATDFLIDGKIDANSNIQTILDLFGEPTYISFVISENFAYMKIKYDSLKFTMSVDGNTIYSVEWT